MHSKTHSDARLRERLGRLAVFAVWVVIYLAMYGCGDAKGRKGETTAQQRKTKAQIYTTAARTSPPPTAIVTQPPEDAEDLGESEDRENRLIPEDVSFEDAYATFVEERYGEAAELFTVYAERHPENAWGHYMKGLSARKSGSVTDAERAFERALELDPTHVKSLLNLGRVLLDDGRPEEALRRVETALELDPLSGDGLRILGRALFATGDEEEAIEAYQQAIAIDDEDAWSMNNLGLILIQWERFDEALLPLARATQLQEDVAVFQNNLGVALERTGHVLASAEAYAKAVAIDASYDKAAVSLARVQGQQDDPLTEPIDLSVLARRFAAAVERWQRTTAQEVVPGVGDGDTVEAAQPVVTIAVPDSVSVKSDSVTTSVPIP